jgi:hypothetical protein
MTLSLCFCRWSLHKRHYSWSNRLFPHQSRDKQKWISNVMARRHDAHMLDMQQALYLPIFHLKMVRRHFQWLFKCLPFVSNRGTLK